MALALFMGGDGANIGGGGPWRKRAFGGRAVLSEEVEKGVG